MSEYTPWDHLIHRRPLEEFTHTGIVRTAALGEWFVSEINPDKAEQMTVEHDTRFTAEIAIWQYRGEEDTLTYYESGYYDGLRNYVVNEVLYERDPEYRVGYRDGSIETTLSNLDAWQEWWHEG